MEPKGEHVTLEIKTQEDVGQLLFLINQLRSGGARHDIIIDVRTEPKVVVEAPKFGRKTKGYYY